MSMDDVFQELMTQTCTIAPFTSRNEFGDRATGDAVTYPCRQEVKQHLVVNIQGEEVVARSRVFVGRSSSGALPTTITPDDLFTDPDSNTPPVLSVDAYPAHSDAEHVVLHLG